MTGEMPNKKTEVTIKVGELVDMVNEVSGRVIKKKVDASVKEQVDVINAIYDRQMKKIVAEQKSQTEKIDKMYEALLGNEKFNIPGKLDELDSLKTYVDDIMNERKAVKIALSMLGVTSVSSLVGFVITLLQAFGK